MALRIRVPQLGDGVIPAQTGVPISDITDGSWLNELSTNTNLFASIDETVASDTDYIISPTLSSGFSDTCEVGLTALTDPVSSSSHTVAYRYRAQGVGTMNLTVRLMQGVTIIASWTHTSVSTSYAVATQTLSGAEADAITDYGDLRFRFVATGA